MKQWQPEVSKWLLYPHRRRLVGAEAQRLEALGATLVRVICEDGLDHYGVAMRDPEGNEFDSN